MDWHAVRRSSRSHGEAPKAACIEACWRMKGPSGRVLECSIYRHMAGVELRCGYGADDLLRSQVVPELGTGRELSEQWRQTVLAKGGFEELPVG